MKLILAICSEDFSIDRYTNRLSLFNIVDGYSAIEFPILVPKVVLIASLDKEDTDEPESRAKLVIFNNESQVGEQDILIAFNNDGTARLATTFALAINGPGTMSLRLAYKGQLQDLYRIKVMKVDSAPLDVR